jgi:hypothetical protein
MHFSKIGEPCTELERHLLLSANIPAPSNSTELLITAGKKIGADNLAIVLDEMGGSHAFIPKRYSFFADLYRPLRVTLVLDLRKQGYSGREIAERLGISERTVDSDLSAAFGRTLRR